MINFHCFAFFSVFFIFAQWNRKICRVFLRRHFFPIWCAATGQRRRYTIPTYVLARGGWGWWVVLLCWVCDSSPLPFLFSLLFVKSVGKWQNSNDHYYEWIDEMEYPLKPSPPQITLSLSYFSRTMEQCILFWSIMKLLFRVRSFRCIWYFLKTKVQWYILSFLVTFGSSRQWMEKSNFNKGRMSHGLTSFMLVLSHEHAMKAVVASTLGLNALHYNNQTWQTSKYCN